MATYLEIFDLRNDSPLKNRVTVACIVAAEAIRGESVATENHVNRMAWAARVFANPEHESTRMLWALLAANNSATVSQIQTATDATIQTAVNSAVNIFATG